MAGARVALGAELSDSILTLDFGPSRGGWQVLESPLEKKAGVNFGPPGTKTLIYFVDDLNMPKLDAYETAMPISLIRCVLAITFFMWRMLQ